MTILEPSCCIWKQDQAGFAPWYNGYQIQNACLPIAENLCLVFNIYIKLGFKAFPQRVCQRFLTEVLLDPVQSHKKFCLNPQHNFIYTRKSPKLMQPLVWRLFTDSSTEIAPPLHGIHIPTVVRFPPNQPVGNGNPHPLDTHWELLDEQQLLLIQEREGWVCGSRGDRNDGKRAVSSPLGADLLLLYATF